jgi:hypothetical protein
MLSKCGKSNGKWFDRYCNLDQGVLKYKAEGDADSKGEIPIKDALLSCVVRAGRRLQPLPSSPAAEEL